MEGNREKQSRRKESRETKRSPVYKNEGRRQTKDKNNEYFRANK